MLHGLGVTPEHCVFEMEGGEVFVAPCGASRLCVNGRLISERTRLRHGFRLLVGSNHLFRVNCPRRAEGAEQESSEAGTGTGGTDWEMAQEELLKSDEDWEHEKQFALEEQRKMFEIRLAELQAQSGGGRNPQAELQAKLVGHPICSLEWLKFFLLLLLLLLFLLYVLDGRKRNGCTNG